MPRGACASAAPQPAPADQTTPAPYVTPGLEAELTGVDPADAAAVAAAAAANATAGAGRLQAQGRDLRRGGVRGPGRASGQKVGRP